MQRTRRTRLARERRLDLARQGLRRESSVATASDYLYHLIDLIECLERLPPLYLYCRVSDVKQYRSGNAHDLAEWSESELQRLGLGHVERHIYTCHESSHVQEDRPTLRQVIADARSAGGIVVAPFRDRFIRHQDFDGTNDSDNPTVAEYRELLNMADGVRLATIQHPDKDSRSLRTRIAINAKNQPHQRDLLKAVNAMMRNCH